MQRERGRRLQIRGLMIPYILALLALSVFPALGEKPPKTYPEQGKILGTGFSSITHTRTYKVVTDTRSYDLDCGKHPGPFSTTPGECGGDKKLQIGDVIHFRLEKGRAYIPVPETVEPGGEQHLRVLREEVRSNAKPADGAPAAQPEPTGAKPQREQQ